MKKARFNSISMTRFASTVALAGGFEAPECAEPPIEWLAQSISECCGEPFDRVFIYNADCVGQWLYEKYTDFFQPVVKNTLIAVPMCSVDPAVTPVNFATMYTGASPDVHGIKVYEKPVVKTDTLFDSARRSGKQVALVSLYDVGTMTKIFKERDLDYFVANSDGESEAITHRLIDEDKHDFISTYVMDYDYIEHRKGPESPEALNALKAHMDRFGRLVDHIRAAWAKHNTLVIFTTDHGVHAVNENGRLGDHGDNIPEDRNVLHFWGCVKSRKELKLSEI